jgi:hypothetical protein
MMILTLSLGSSTISIILIVLSIVFAIAIIVGLFMIAGCLEEINVSMKNIDKCINGQYECNIKKDID